MAPAKTTNIIGDIHFIFVSHHYYKEQTQKIFFDLSVLEIASVPNIVTQNLYTKGY